MRASNRSILMVWNFPRLIFGGYCSLEDMAMWSVCYRYNPLLSLSFSLSCFFFFKHHSCFDNLRGSRRRGGQRRNWLTNGKDWTGPPVSTPPQKTSMSEGTNDDQFGQSVR